MMYLYTNPFLWENLKFRSVIRNEPKRRVQLADFYDKSKDKGIRFGLFYIQFQCSNCHNLIAFLEAKFSFQVLLVEKMKYIAQSKDMTLEEQCLVYL